MDVIIYFTFRHNFNGTSKGAGETVSRPCAVPSQLILNEIRRGKS